MSFLASQNQNEEMVVAKRERRANKTEAKGNLRYGSQERLEVIREVDSGKSMVEVAKRCNIHPVTIKRWNKQLCPKDVGF